MKGSSSVQGGRPYEYDLETCSHGTSNYSYQYFELKALNHCFKSGNEKNLCSTQGPTATTLCIWKISVQ